MRQRPSSQTPNSPSSPATTVADDSGEDEVRRRSTNSARSSAVADDIGDDEVRRGSTNSARPGTVADDDGDDEVPDPPIYNSPTSYLAGDGTDHERRNGSYSRLSYGAPAHNSTDDEAENLLNDHSLASPRASLTAHDRSRTLSTERATTSPVADPATDEGARVLSYDTTPNTRSTPSGDVAPLPPSTRVARSTPATERLISSTTADREPLPPSPSVSAESTTRGEELRTPRGEEPPTPPWAPLDLPSTVATERMVIDIAQDYPVPLSAGFGTFINDVLPESLRFDSIRTRSDEIHHWAWRQWGQFSFWDVLLLWIYITAHVRDSASYVKASVTNSIRQLRMMWQPMPWWFWLLPLLYVGGEIASRRACTFQSGILRYPGQLVDPMFGLPSILFNGISKVNSNYQDAREFDCCLLPSPPPNCHCPMTEEESYAKVVDYIFRVAEESGYAEATEDTLTEETEQDSDAEATKDTSTTTKVKINHSEAMNDMFTMVTDAENDLIREVRKLAHITLPDEGPIADLLREYRILVEPTGAQKFVSRLYSVREQIQQELYREAQYLADIFPAEGRIAAVLRQFGMLEKSPHERGRAAFQASLQAFVDKLKLYASVVEDSPSAKKGGSVRKAFMDKLRRKGSAFPNKHDAEHATAKALWDLLKIAGIPVKLEEGRYIYLNGHRVTDSTTWDEIFEMMKKGTPVNKSEFGQRWGNNYAFNLKSQQGRGKSTSKAGEAYPEGQPFVASNTKRTGK